MIRASASRLSPADLPGSRRQRGDPPRAKPRHGTQWAHWGARHRSGSYFHFEGLAVLDRDTGTEPIDLQHGFRSTLKKVCGTPNGGYCLQSAAHCRITAQTAATVPDVEQRIIDLERKHLRHQSATLAILSACWCGPRYRLSSRRSRQFRAPQVACRQHRTSGIVGHWVCSFDPLRRTDPRLRVRMLRFALWAALTSGALRAEIVSKTAAAKTQE
ncbi:hypothetical protein ABIC01_008062 [Bradyrhizobium sp. RT4b]